MDAACQQEDALRTLETTRALPALGDRAMLGAAEARRMVLVDGFIAGAAALAALDIRPDIRGHLVFAHRSAEQGHAALLSALGVEPLLDLGLRLGEGSGALLAWPLLSASAAMLNEMASFESAAVSGPA